MSAPSLDALRDRLPEYAKDMKLNLQTLLGEASLGPARTWGVALAAAAAARRKDLRQALEAEARAKAGDAVVEDALAAAVLMGMTNVYYRFKHLVGKPAYEALPARLRMNRVARPAGEKTDFELFCLAVSAVNACGACVQAHEKTLVEQGVAEAEINDAVRLASTVHAVAVALDAAEEAEG